MRVSLDSLLSRDVMSAEEAADCATRVKITDSLEKAACDAFFIQACAPDHMELKNRSWSK